MMKSRTVTQLKKMRNEQKGVSKTLPFVQQIIKNGAYERKKSVKGETFESEKR